MSVRVIAVAAVRGLELMTMAVEREHLSLSEAFQDFAENYHAVNRTLEAVLTRLDTLTEEIRDVRRMLSDQRSALPRQECDPA